MRIHKDAANNKNKSWLIKTIIYVVVVVGLFLLIQWDAVIGFLVILLLISTICVGFVLEAYTNYPTQSRTKLVLIPEEQLEKSQALLKYATAVLAFLSLTTTAEGMKSFVFVEQSWMAYLGSFAVQSILVVFSLLLCRFYVQIASLDWPKYVKRLAGEMLVLFFASALIVSSIFSFTYIANNAYTDTQVSDSEYMLQEYLVSAVQLLREANNEKKAGALENIRTIADENLSGAIAEAQKKKEAKGNEKFAELLNNIVPEHYSGEEAGIDLDYLKDENSNADEQVLNKVLDDYSVLYESKYIDAVKYYNNVMDAVKTWQDDFSTLMNSEDSASISEYKVNIQKSIAAYKDGLKDNRKKLTAVNKNIDDWKPDNIQIDRTRFKVANDEFIVELQRLWKSLERLEKLEAAEAAGTEPVETESPEGGDLVSGTPGELDDILSKVYLLGADQTTTPEELIRQIYSKALAFEAEGVLNSEQLHSLMSIKDYIEEYNECLELDKKLDEYVKSNMDRTDLLTLDGIEDKDEGKEAQDEGKEAQDEGKKAQDEGKEAQDEGKEAQEAWKNKRNEDLNTMLQWLKAFTVQKNTAFTATETIQEEGQNDQSESEEKKLPKEQQKLWEKMNDSFDEGIRLKRNLLGNLTDFENAFNYFKSDYPMMAFFSAFIAVFFDLGAFFTGCFLYCTEFFVRKKDQNVDKQQGQESGKEETNPERAEKPDVPEEAGEEEENAVEEQS